MVKVNKVAAYQVGDKVFTDRVQAEKAVRREAIKEVLDAELSFGGVVCAADVADALANHWSTVEGKIEQAFRGIS